jgi:TRAP-type C4-dicarboxylate transport system permease large subunit
VLRSAITASTVLIIIATARIFSMVVTLEQVGLIVGNIVKPVGYFGFILIVNITLLIVGTCIDLVPAVLIFAPILAPIADSLGIHPIQFGIIVIVNLIIGFITPPLGAIFFVVAPLAGVTIEELAKAIVPFLIAAIVVLFLVSYIPAITLAIPKIFGFFY